MIGRWRQLLYFPAVLNLLIVLAIFRVISVGWGQLLLILVLINWLAIMVFCAATSWNEAAKAREDAIQKGNWEESDGGIRMFMLNGRPNGFYGVFTLSKVNRRAFYIWLFLSLSAFILQGQICPTAKCGAVM